MARSIWTGSLSFGLVNVPVGLLSATEQKDVAFHQREKGTNARIRYKRVAEDTNREVDYDDIVKGYELSGDTFVTLTKDEVGAADLGKSRNIEITDFVDIAEVDPIYFEKTYYLAPKDKSAHGAYGLLRDAMAQTGLAGVASFIMRGKEYLAVIRTWKRVLVLETMLFADEVRDPEDVIDELPRAHKKDSREIKAAVNLIEQLTTQWDPERYHDTYRERLLGIVRDKAKGREVSVEAPGPRREKVVDLMDALQRSIDEAKGKGSRRPQEKARKASGTTKTAAAKSRARKSADVTGLSKQELYDRAAKLDIAGRSKMSRAQLERAVAKAS
ncbi:Ku protein [Actinopolymorpha sp. B17G11]|uniref:non-homologous end joining protein Ku n=1 Tax=Actinopolymorpha sp. B17G11 TaxID=3160861 RepID=UPI0032E474ED